MKKTYYAPVAEFIEMEIGNNILTLSLSEEEKGGGSALGKKQQGEWGNLWNK